MGAIPVTPYNEYRGARRKVMYRADFGAVEATGTSPATARAAVQELAEKALTGSYKPVMYFYANNYALVYRTPDGWGYRYGSGWPNDTLQVADQLYGFIPCYDQTREQTLQSARLYIAQCAYPIQNGLDFLKGDNVAIVRHCHWLGFQSAYKTARLRGMTDTDAHQWAGDHADDETSLTIEERRIFEAAQANLSRRRDNGF